jgi:uncharacterized protein (UPF0332 family)
VKPELEKLTRHRLSRAKHAFNDGEQLFSMGSLEGAVNRFYYAAFYAARALLATRELDSGRHSGVISLFQRNFVASGFVDRETAKALPRAFEKRQKGDYGDFSEVTAGEAQSVRDEVGRFLEACSRAIDRLAAESE